MICPKCNREIDYGLNICPYCGANLSFSTKVRDELDYEQSKELGQASNSLKKGYNVGVLIAIFLSFTIIGYFSTSKFFYINKLFRIVNIILNVMLYTGIAGIIVSIVLFIKRKYLKLTKALLIISIAFMISSIAVSNSKIIKNNISLVDYSTVEYIDIGSEKIPSLYSVVGKKEIVFSENKKNYSDEGTNVKGDLIFIIYTDLTESDKEKYTNELVKYGFNKTNIYVEDENEYINVYAMNNTSTNTFYVVSVDGLAITYFTSKGTYEEALKTK